MSHNQSFDKVKLGEESRNIEKNAEQILERGAQLEHEKAILVAKIEEIQCSRLSEESQRILISEIDAVIADIQKQYEREVTWKMEDVQRDLEACTENMQEAADDLEKEETTIREIHMEASETDTSAAADAAAAEKREFEDMKRENVNKMELLLEQKNRQQRNILARRLRGR